MIRERKGSPANARRTLLLTLHSLLFFLSDLVAYIGGGYGGQQGGYQAPYGGQQGGYARESSFPFLLLHLAIIADFVLLQPKATVVTRVAATRAVTRVNRVAVSHSIVLESASCSSCDRISHVRENGVAARLQAFCTKQ